MISMAWGDYQVLGAVAYIPLQYINFLFPSLLHLHRCEYKSFCLMRFGFRFVDRILRFYSFNCLSVVALNTELKWALFRFWPCFVCCFVRRVLDVVFVLVKLC